MTKNMWTGDSGKTHLFGEQTVEKSSLLVNSYGWIDELNAVIGLCRVSVKDRKIKDLLKQVQHHLFIMGADLATPLGDLSSSKINRMSQKEIEWIEGVVKHVENKLPEMNKFILPGGSEGAAQLHVARTVCRRAERAAFAANKEQEINSSVIKYLNRLSSLLFSLSRYENMLLGIDEEEWKG